jgi:uroporphyrinogen decarboxylase
MPMTKDTVFQPQFRLDFENDLMIRTLAGEQVSSPPVWLMRQAGRYLPEYREVRQNFPDFMSLCRSADATTEVALQPLRRFQLDAAIVFSDILTIADSLDMGLRFMPGEGPLLRRPITQPDQIDALPFDSCIERLTYVFKAVSSLRAALGKRLPIIGFSGSPWTQACYMLSGYGEKQFTTAKRFAFTHPVAMTNLLRRLSAVTAEYLFQQYVAGADILFVIDTWGGLLGDSHFSIFSSDMLAMICDQLRQMGCLAPVMFFSKGLTTRRLQPIVSIPNVSCIGVDWCADMPQLQREFPEMTFQGNLDPVVLHAGPVTTQQHVSAMLQSLRTEQRTVAALGHGILPETPIDSVHAFIDTVRSRG